MYVQQDPAMLKHLNWGAINKKGRLHRRAGGLEDLMKKIICETKDRRAKVINIECDDLDMPLLSFVTEEEKHTLACKLAAVYASMRRLPEDATIQVPLQHVDDVLTLHMQKQDRYNPPSRVPRDPRNKFLQNIKLYKDAKAKFINAKDPSIYEKSMGIWKCIFCPVKICIGSYEKFTLHMLQQHEREVILVHVITKYGITIYRNLIDKNIFEHLHELQAHFHGFQHLIIDQSSEKFTLKVVY